MSGVEDGGTEPATEDLESTFVVPPEVLPNRLEIRRGAVCDAIDVNLILARRIKKLNFELNEVPYLPNGVGLRMVKISNKNYESKHSLSHHPNQIVDT